MIEVYNHKGENSSLQEVGSLLLEEQKKTIISVIGAGGKSSLIQHLAECYSKQNKKVLVTTTTHIWRPTNDTFAENIEAAERVWAKKQYVVVGEETKQKKLKALSVEKLQPYWRRADVILIEADGAKGYPCKVSKTTEPIIMPETTSVLMVMGLKTLSKRMRDVCFRCELVMDLLDEDRDHVMTEEDLMTIFRQECVDGMKDYKAKKYLVMNQADTKRCKKSGVGFCLEVMETEGILGFVTKCM